MSYAIGWGVAIAATGGLAFLVYVVLKRHKLIAAWIISLGCFWALFPWQFQEGNFAPIFVVFFFRLYLERDADASLVGAIGFLGTVGICTLFAVLAVFQKVLKVRKNKLV